MNLREFEHRLKKLSVDIEDKVLVQSTKAPARFMRDRVREVAPFDEGDLEASIVTAKDKFGYYVRVKIQQGIMYYARLLEYGWEDKPEGVPFVQPAALVYGDKARNMQRSEFFRLLDTVAETKSA